MKILRIISAVLMLVGLGALAAALSSYRTQAQFIDDASTATGEVTKVVTLTSHSRKGSSTYYAFEVRFMTPRGDTVQGRAMQTSSSPDFAEGERVPVLFSRDKPSVFTIETFGMLWVSTVVPLVIGACLLGAGAAAFWIAGGRPPGGRVRYESNLREMARAWREGRLTRDSAFQPLLIAFTFVGFGLGGAVLLFLLFVNPVVQAIVGALLALVMFRAIMANRRKPKKP